MEEEAKSRSYPAIPARNWWSLRRRFQQARPGRVDADYLQAVLGVGEGHAKNLIPQLRAVGLIDDSGKPTDLADDWRDDDGYSKACAAILKAVYPQGLRDALPPPAPDYASVEQWFMRNARVGRAAARKMTSFYRLLCSADVSEGQEPAAQRTSGVRRREDKVSRAASVARTSPRIGQAGRPAESVVRVPPDGPTIHIDVQIHISPEATAEQIDSIFAAMAKHLYKR